jgi:hypothetical protein
MNWLTRWAQGRLTHASEGGEVVSVSLREPDIDAPLPSLGEFP